MVRKENLDALLAYTLLRTFMWQAAHKAGVAPLRVSRQGASVSNSSISLDLATATLVAQTALSDSTGGEITWPSWFSSSQSH